MVTIEDLMDVDPLITYIQLVPNTAWDINLFYDFCWDLHSKPSLY